MIIFKINLIKNIRNTQRIILIVKGCFSCYSKITFLDNERPLRRPYTNLLKQKVFSKEKFIMEKYTQSSMGNISSKKLEMGLCQIIWLQ